MAAMRTRRPRLALSILLFWLLAAVAPCLCAAAGPAPSPATLPAATTPPSSAAVGHCGGAVEVPRVESTPGDAPVPSLAPTTACCCSRGGDQPLAATDPGDLRPNLAVAPLPRLAAVPVATAARLAPARPPLDPSPPPATIEVLRI